MSNLPRLSWVPFISSTNNVPLIPCFPDEVHVVSYLALSITGNCLQLPQLRVEGGFSVALDDRWQGYTARGGRHAPASPEGAYFCGLGTHHVTQQKCSHQGLKASLSLTMVSVGGRKDAVTGVLSGIWWMWPGVIQCNNSWHTLNAWLDQPSPVCVELSHGPPKLFLDPSCEKGLGQCDCGILVCVTMP